MSENLEEFTKTEYNENFRLARLNDFPYEYRDWVPLTVTFEVNLNLKLITREGYYFLDLMSDVGGLFGILFPAITIILSFTNYNYLDNYLSSKLFKLESEH